MRGIAYSAVMAMAAFPVMAQAALVQFSTASGDSYAENFVDVFFNGTGSSYAQHPTNHNLVHSAGTTASNLIAKFDNPSGGAPTTFSATNFTVSADVRLGASGNSFGFFIGTPSDSTANDLLALFNIDRTDSPYTGLDTLRFAPNGNFAANGAGTLIDSAAADTALAVNSVITLTLTVTDGNKFSLSATDGTHSLSSTSVYEGYTLPASFEIGFRSGAVMGSSNIIDNFSITVPEPTSLAALGLAAALMGGRRRG